MNQRERCARQAWLAIVRIFRSDETARLFAATAESEDLTPRLLQSLLVLSRDEGKAMHELADDCFSTPSYMTTVVDGLEQRGLARRRTDPDDRRVKLVTLTEDGTAAVERARERLARPPSGFDALTDEELASLGCLLERAAEHYPW